jgi:hypothetical protein
MARQMGSTLRNLQKMRARLEDEMRTAVPDVDLPRIARSARSPGGAVAGFVAGLATQGGTEAKTEESGAGEEVSDPGIALPGEEMGDDNADEYNAEGEVYGEGPADEQVWGESDGGLDRSYAGASGSVGGREERVSADDPSMN